MEFCLHAFAIPHRVAEFARRAEAWGFSGRLLATDAPSVLRPSVQKAIRQDEERSNGLGRASW